MPPSSRLWLRWLPTPEPNSVTLKVEAAVNTLNLTLDTFKNNSHIVRSVHCKSFTNLYGTNKCKFYFDILRTVHHDIFL